VHALHDAGATWAVFGRPVDVGELVTVARSVTESGSSEKPGSGS
jgi:hypothetical protein